MVDTTYQTMADFGLQQQHGNEEFRHHQAPVTQQRVDSSWINAELSRLASMSAPTSSGGTVTERSSSKRHQGPTKEGDFNNLSGDAVGESMRRRKLMEEGGFAMSKWANNNFRDTSSAFLLASLSGRSSSSKTTMPILRQNPPSPTRNAFFMPSLHGENKLIRQNPKLLSYKSLWKRTPATVRKSLLVLQIQQSRVPILQPTTTSSSMSVAQHQQQESTRRHPHGHNQNFDNTTIGGIRQDNNNTTYITQQQVNNNGGGGAGVTQWAV